jgi:hypothetical protein
MRNFLLPAAGALALTAIEVSAFLHHNAFRSPLIQLKSAVEKHLSASDVNSRLIAKLEKIKAKDSNAKSIRREVSNTNTINLESGWIHC